MTEGKDKNDAAAAVQAASSSETPTTATTRMARMPWRSRRLGLLAATVALAASLGAIVGSAGMNAAVRLFPGGAFERAVAEESRVLKEHIAQLAAELSALKASIEASSKSAHVYFSKVSDAMERGRNEPGMKLAKLSEPETTGSIASAQAKASDGSAQAKAPDRKPRMVAGWVIHDVFRGRALLEGRHGTYVAVRGSHVPGIGRIEEIKRQDGRWVVVTAKGLITSYR
jgi:hypothetical protein